MEKIELELWKPKDDDPRYAERAGQRSGMEVFEELKQRLDGMGLLPDEYFDLDMEWENGKLIPSGADIFVTTDYGESEGIYLDLYLKWYEDGKPVTSRLAIGKTLGETGADMDRMFLISSAITKAFHGDHGEYARNVKLGPQEKGGDMIVNLTPAEQRLFIDALVERREKMLGAMDDTEKLLRRMTGSITAYMDLVGERPLHLSDYDRASLAIRDGELAAFKELLHNVKERVGDLLIEAAGRAGDVGRKMTLEIVAYAPEFMSAAYTAASLKAAEIGDTERVKFLMGQAQHSVAGFDPSYYGQVIDYAYSENRRMGQDLIAYAPNEWIAAAPSDLLVRAMRNQDYHVLGQLLDKGIDTANNAAEILSSAYSSRDRYMAKFLVQQGMTIEPGDCRALDVCVSKGDTKTSLLLLDRGMDFEKYAEWSDKNYGSGVTSPVVDAMREHWQNMHQEQTAAPEEAPAQGQTMGGLSQ